MFQEVLSIQILIEGIASLLSLACVILAAQNKIANWPVAILASLVYAYVFHQNRFFSETYLQFIFIGFQSYGWWFWSKFNPQKTEQNIKYTPTNHKPLILLGFITFYLTWYFIYLRINPDARLPLLDCFLTAVSVTALFMQAKKWIENWYLWILADILYVPMFIVGDQYITASLYFIFIGLATKGYFMWKSEMKKASN
ncbi:nicotinamide riboside transporter PnuC [Bacteroidia bacterium]|nr:nicotinamide riboside transporter PnuC [Bacteroidia bacterium]